MPVSRERFLAGWMGVNAMIPSSQQARQNLVGCAFKVARNISQDRLEGPERKHLVVRHGDERHASGLSAGRG